MTTNDHGSNWTTYAQSGEQGSLGRDDPPTVATNLSAPLSRGGWYTAYAGKEISADVEVHTVPEPIDLLL
ncbi:MAG: hypothetical protein JWR19_820 [Pedosphaera sp.]|nr:hypothetical protein [Pedosphaera sp.]